MDTLAPELLEALVGLDLATLVVGPDDALIHATPAAIRLLGAAPMAPGASVSGALGPARALLGAMTEVRARGVAVVDRPLLRAAQPEAAPVLVTFTPLAGDRLLLHLRTTLAATSHFDLTTLERLLRLSRDAVAVTLPDQRIVAVNPAACALTGYTREELVGYAADDIGLFDAVPARGTMIAALRQHGLVRDVPLPLRRKDGETRDVLLSAQRLEVAGEPLHMFVATDVTELRDARQRGDRADAYASERAALLQAVFEASPAAITVTRADNGRYVAVNPAFERATGIPAPAALGRDSVELGLVASDEAQAQGLAAVLETGRLEASVVHQTRDGREVHAQFSAVVVDLGGEPHVVSITLDTTAQHRLEEQVEHGRRLEAIGQLAGGVAHDFNNVLAAIISGAELLATEPGTDGALAHLILDAAQRGADLTRQLLAFSRKRKIVATAFDVHEAIHSTVSLLQRTIDPRVVLALHLDAADSHVHGDASVLGNALLNLGLNARDAMPDGGRLTFATRNVTLDAVDCVGTLLPITPGRFLEVRVSDTGTGIAPELMRRVFEPFFTTKPVGRGTGLGLAVAHGAVADHGGTLGVVSATGVGTTFTLQLPVTEVAAASVARRAVTAPQRVGHALVVEDNTAVATTAMALLRSVGLTAVHATDGLDALARLDGDEAFDVILLDLVMPRLGGLEALPEIRKRRPTVPVILTSGYNEADHLESLLARGEIAAFLPKPFRIAALREALTRALGHAP